MFSIILGDSLANYITHIIIIEIKKTNKTQIKCCVLYAYVRLCVCVRVYVSKPKQKFRDFTFYTAKENFLSITKNQKPKNNIHPSKILFFLTTNLPAIKPVVTW